MKKDDMLKIASKLDFWVSPNLSKDKTSTRIAKDMIEYPENIYYKISKSELPLVGELLNAAPDEYVVRKVRKLPYQVQKLGLVVTYEDILAGEWHMLMPKNLRLPSMLHQLYGEK